MQTWRGNGEKTCEWDRDFALQLQRKLNLGDSLSSSSGVIQVNCSFKLASFPLLKADRQLNVTTWRGWPAFPFQVKQVYMFSGAHRTNNRWV